MRSISPLRKRSGTGPISFAGTPAHNVPGANFFPCVTTEPDATLTNLTIIHHDRAHADEHVIRYGTTVYNRIVTNAYIVAYGRGELLIGAMDRGVVLHIHFISKGDAVDVAADDASKPETASVATFKLANDGCIIRYKTIGAEFGRMSKQGLDVGHGIVV